jgi:hypothetical protein
LKDLKPGKEAKGRTGNTIYIGAANGGSGRRRWGLELLTTMKMKATKTQMREIRVRI